MSELHPGQVLPEDLTGQDAWDQVITALPVTEDEIDDLLYGEERPAQERVARLREIAGQLRDMQPGDLGGDTKVLLGEIDEAVARLSGGVEQEPALEYNEGTVDDDPLNHRETLSPDSDELEDIEEDDEMSLDSEGGPLPDDVLDPEEWQDNDDGFDVEKGVH